ncbi:Crp/Fnr family transcriptional regulator [Helicovermis profundi]|uniref:Crp/Fnr family transcriptional regulator n=1 Tax=Helicovermis profundi TaxID=3065157 RepID=A0AAU9DZQ7_9FIRM|nr:Crp/Fnr family transcriptional regulator [Clostridia bacterium S502]
MNKVSNALKNCDLFKKLSDDNINHILGFIDNKTITYKKGSIIAFEGDDCDSLGIVLEGTVELQTIFPSGKISTVMQMEESDIFGEALIFSSYNKYPISIVSITNSKLILLKKDKILHLLMHHPVVLENFLFLLSTKLFVLNSKVKMLSLDTIRQKICTYLISESRNQNSLRVKVKLSRKHMAEHMAVQRPSLSRELIKMEKEGLIKVDKNYITIVNMDDFEMELG